MSNELKPVRCGCGGEAWTDYIIGEPSEGVGWFVCCKNCDIQTPAEYPTEAEAIEAWNTAMSNVQDCAKDARCNNGYWTIVHWNSNIVFEEYYDWIASPEDPMKAPLVSLDDTNFGKTWQAYRKERE